MHEEKMDCFSLLLVESILCSDEFNSVVLTKDATTTREVETEIILEDTDFQTLRPKDFESSLNSQYSLIPRSLDEDTIRFSSFIQFLFTYRKIVSTFPRSSE